MNALTGKVALITGATSGIGEACALRFAEAGAYVLVAGRNEERGQVVVSTIITNGGRAEFVQLDVESDFSIEKCYNYIKKKIDKIDILFNNAGVFPVTPPIESIDRESTNRILNTNTAGIIMMVHFFINIIKDNGTILNNASVAGLQNYNSGQCYAYSASKAAVVKFTQLLAKKYGNRIRVNAISPGVIKTPIFKKFDEERYRSMIPMGRTGTADDVAKVANFLVSDDASYVNGAIVPVDGGQSL